VAAPGLLAALQAEDGTGRAHQIAIDGGSGEVVIDPDAPARRRFEAALLDEEARRADALRHAHEPVVTLDGVRVSLLANIGTPEEAAGARELGALGVGLFRTEFLFLERSSPPSEAEQVDAYERVVRTFEPHPVTIRLLDVGGDKPIPYLRLGAEANPFLGVRALRLARTDAELFLTQLRACYRAAAAGPIKVMAPMVADLSDVELLLTLAERAHAQLEAEGRPIGELTLGVMLEIPSAILVADSYFSRIGFASLGTNDLHQYALAVDRGNAALEAYRDPLHPGVLKLVGMAVEAGNRAGIEISVCGEMAGDPASALALVALGVRSLSMASTSLPGVARAIRGATADELAAVIEVALTAPSAASVRSSFEALAKGAVPA
jgi:phosphoenolpyruvate-protein phosphotransferase